MSDHFTKQRADAPADFFPVEAAGLRWLSAAGPEAARIVEVFDVGSTGITLQRLTPASPTGEAAADFGRRLAVTHDAGADAFGQGPDGWDGDGYIGQQRLLLRPTRQWGAFYAEQRLLPYARAARDRGHLDTGAADRIVRLCSRLTDGEFDDGQPPARIHGDLWAGNVIFTDDGVVLIDPAAHGGHRLTDLAMLALFGTPYLEMIFAAYAEAAGLEPDFTELIGLHQLHPLLVHAVSHGPSYGHEAGEVARRY